MQAGSQIEWSNAVREIVVFTSNMLAVGAVGFRFGVLRPAVESISPGLASDARSRAAWLGFTAMLAQVGLFLYGMSGQAARKQLSLGGAIAAGGTPTQIQILALALMGMGFLLAARRVGAGWPLALAGVVILPLRGLATGDWTRIVNPVHMSAAGLWIGTLFVLVVVGVRLAFRHDVAGEVRGRMVAAMVRSFSPLALGAAALLALFGVMTARLHLKYWAAIWTTPYGTAFMVKLCLVAVVVALGAWNWKRMAPAMGSEAAAGALRQSARRELVAAGCVLLATSILVSLPTPKLPDAVAAGTSSVQPAP